MKKVSEFFKKFAAILVNNWPLKLLSLFLATCLWAGLISQDNSLTRERIFSDVTVTVNGADSLRRNNGLIVLNGLEQENLLVRLRVNVPQNQYNTVTTANYNPRIDLTKITETGEQTLKILTTSSATYGSVSSIVPDTVKVTVDEYISNYRVPVVIRSEGALKNGWYGGTPSSDPTTVTISGPASIVSRVSRVCVDYSLSKLPERSGRIRTALPFTFEDNDGNLVESDQLEVSSENVVLRSITVNQMLYPQKSLQISTDGIISGSPDSDYLVASVSISPQTVNVAAEQSVLDALETVFADGSINIDGKIETFTGTLKLKKTSDIIDYSPDNISVTVQLEPVSVSRTFTGLKPSVFGLSDAYHSSLSVKTLSVIISGPKEIMRSLRSSSVTAYISAENLSEGIYTVPVQLLIDGADMSCFTFSSSPSSVEITIQPKS